MLRLPIFVQDGDRIPSKYAYNIYDFYEILLFYLLTPHSKFQMMPSLKFEQFIE